MTTTTQGLRPSDPGYWRALRAPGDPDLSEIVFPEPEHTSRDPWPDGFALPRGVASMKRTAEASGWSVRQTYSRGWVPDGTTGRPIGYAHRIALQCIHPETKARAVMVYEVSCESGAMRWKPIILGSRHGLTPYGNATDAKDFLLLSGGVLPGWYEVIRTRVADKATKAKAAPKKATAKRRESGG